GLDTAGPERPTGAQDRAFAGHLSEAAAANHPAYRLRAALAGVRSPSAWRARVPDQADIAESLARPNRVDPGQPPCDRKHRKMLRSRATRSDRAERPQAGRVIA